MYFIQLNKIRFLYLLIVLVIMFCFTSIFVKASVDTLLPDEKNIESSSNGKSEEDYNDNESFNTKDVGSNEDYEASERSERKNPLYINDSVFSNNGNITFKDLVIRVMFIVFALLTILFVVKVYLSKNQLIETGSFLDNIAQRFGSNFSNFTPSNLLKLKQTLMLTPGQNLYFVEVEGKKLLIGGTHQGGVQFLADLTNTTFSNELNFRQIPEFKVEDKPQVQYEISNGFVQNSFAKDGETENPFLTVNSSLKNEVVKDNLKKKPFKRRVNFKQSLLAGVK